MPTYKIKSHNKSKKRSKSVSKKHKNSKRKYSNKKNNIKNSDGDGTPDGAQPNNYGISNGTGPIIRGSVPAPQNLSKTIKPNYAGYVPHTIIKKQNGNKAKISLETEKVLESRYPSKSEEENAFYKAIDNARAANKIKAQPLH